MNNIEMKESGFKWIGEVPTNWTITKVKYIYSIIGGNGFPDDLQGNDAGEIPFCKVSDINGDNVYVNQAQNYISMDIQKRYKFNLIPVNSIVFAKIGEALKKNHRKLNSVVCCLDNNTQALVINDRNRVYFKFSYYLFKIIDMKDFNNEGAVPSINNTKLKNYFIPIPSYNEQINISSILDKKCSNIDSIINDLEKQIEILERYKKSVITEAVTKGLNPNVEFRENDGIYFSNIPNHWNVFPVLFGLKMRITDGPHETPDFYDDGIPFVSAEAISNSNGRINFDKIRGYISEDYYKICSKKYIPMINDIYMIKSGATTGKVAINDSNIKFTIWSPLAVFRCDEKKIDSYFLFYLLQSKQVQEQVQNSWSFGTQQNIGMRVLEKLKITFPPLSEQVDIVNYLNMKCSKVDSIIEDKKNQVETIKKYKNSLIYEYVTGKKRVSQGDVNE